MSVGIQAPSVFDAGLPALSYDISESPHDVYPRIRAAQDISPIALGPLGPEVLSYDLARAILRDPRFVIPPGIHLTAHGITSGPLCDRVVRSILCMEGEEHRRLRSLVSRPSRREPPRVCTTRSTRWSTSSLIGSSTRVIAKWSKPSRGPIRFRSSARS